MPVGLECTAPAPISVMAVHGVDDTRVLYDGGASTVGTARIDATAQQDVHALWARAASCEQVYRGWDATAQLWSFFDTHRRAASG